MKQEKKATAESLGQQQREISVSEFFLKNRHLLGFDNPRKALLTTIKEAVDNSLDACDEAGILPEISVDIEQTGTKRFRMTVTDNGPGILRNQIPKIFARLLYGSKFHRLRMSRGQQGIGISAAGMYGQLTTGIATVIRSRVKNGRHAWRIEVMLDTRANKPVLLKNEEDDWYPQFFPQPQDGSEIKPQIARHGTSVTIEMEAAFVRGRLSVDEYLKQCAIVNPHLALHSRIQLLGSIRESDTATAQQKKKTENEASEDTCSAGACKAPWHSYQRASAQMPEQPRAIKPHPHGLELGMLMQMLKDTSARTLKAALVHDFSRVSARAALEICEKAGLSPTARPAQIAMRESESLYKAIAETKLMRPPTDCLSPIGESAILAGLKKEIGADFYTAITRAPDVYRGNPFQVEIGLAYAQSAARTHTDGSAMPGVDEPARVLRFANRVPLLYMAGACAIHKAITGVNWKNYGLNQPRDGLPQGPLIILAHIASVWVPFTSESKEAVAHYPEIIREMTFALQECGRQLAVFLSRRKRQAEIERKKNYIETYLPHLALGLRQILTLNEQQEQKIVTRLQGMLERGHLEK